MKTHVTAEAIISNGCDVLVLQVGQSGEHGSDGWDLPGGAVGKLEDPHIAIKRQALAATGLRWPQRRLGLQFASTEAWPVNGDHHEAGVAIVRLYFVAATSIRDLPPTQCSEPLWVPRRELLCPEENMPRLSVPSMVALAHVDRYDLWDA